ncbi:hypothetical protein B5V00_14570 [Geothermobacter hydrogeniphilus]|uniref:Uncharacterized protein n=1 Tax=Geothermobacter hydrogeniphilus TaxID=1969733 RepID=A0A1X0XT62_9BACT|nr:hypothetical protein B5V00_14570 [Geothermobacter hydrogeniphilus]
MTESRIEGGDAEKPESNFGFKTQRIFSLSPMFSAPAINQFSVFDFLGGLGVLVAAFIFFNQQQEA